MRTILLCLLMILGACGPIQITHQSLAAGQASPNVHQPLPPAGPVAVVAPFIGIAPQHVFWTFNYRVPEGAEVVSATLKVERVPSPPPFNPDPMNAWVAAPPEDGIWEDQGLGMSPPDHRSVWAHRVVHNETVLSDFHHPPDPSNHEWRLHANQGGWVQEWSADAALPVTAIDVQVVRFAKTLHRDVTVYLYVTDQAGTLFTVSNPKTWPEVDPDGFDGRHGVQRWDFPGDWVPTPGVTYRTWFSTTGWEDMDQPVLAPRAWELKVAEPDATLAAQVWSARVGVHAGRYQYQDQVPFSTDGLPVTIEDDTISFDVAELMPNRPGPLVLTLRPGGFGVRVSHLFERRAVLVVRYRW